MRGDFQKLLVSQDGAPAVLSLNVQAAMGPVREPQRSEFVLLMRHFLERFFNHETASPDGDGKTRLILQLPAGSPSASTDSDRSKCRTRVGRARSSLRGYRHSADVA